MKDLNNIVVEVLDLEHGQKVKDEFINQDIDYAKRFDFSGHKNGNFCFRYYGIIEGIFKDYSEVQVIESKAKIITLDELKSMKEDKIEYPKLMYVWDNDGDEKIKREVIYKDKDGYYAKDGMLEKYANTWQFAQDIEPENQSQKKQVINITLPHDIEAIIMINGKEVEFKKQDQ